MSIYLTAGLQDEMLWRYLLSFPSLSLVLLALLFLRVVHAHGELAGLLAILVLDHQSVFARVGRGDRCDCDAGKLAVLKLEFIVLVGHELSVVLRPGDLWSGLTPHIPGQVQGLKDMKAFFRCMERNQTHYYLCVRNS